MKQRPGNSLLSHNKFDKLTDSGLFMGLIVLAFAGGYAFAIISLAIPVGN